MEKNFFIQNKIEPEKENYVFGNNPNVFLNQNDALVNDFLNQNVSLESLIENEIFKNTL